MKKFALIGLFLGLAVAGMAIYHLAVVEPDKGIADAILFDDHPETWYGSAEHSNVMDRLMLGTDFAIYTLLAGGFAFLVNLFPAIKKQKLAWLGAILSLFATFVGIAFGTHMFS
ncbi:MAG: hypothetical protein V4638_06695 [Bacteroidota bacterium]